jgi:transposase
MSNPELLPMSEPQRRLEIFTGAGRRRSWSAEAKARIVAESRAAGASVCAVARRHGLTPQQLFTWRREARQRGTNAGGGAPAFVPVVLEPAATTTTPERPRRARSTMAATPAVEIEVAGLLVRVRPGMDVETITAVLQAVKTLP